MDWILVVSIFVVLILFYLRNRRTLHIRRELQGILDSIDPVVLLDSEQTIVRANEAYAALCGAGFVDMIGQKIYDIMPSGPAFSSDDSPALEALHLGKIIRRERILLKEKIYDIAYHPILIDKSYSQVLEIRTDVSELYKAQDGLQSQRVELQKKSEELRFSYQQMTVVREQLEKNLREKNDEYSIAREIQLGLLPAKLPTPPGVTFWSSYKPISSVGGDLYDIIPLGNHCYGVFIGDVAGHGLPAAFVGALAKMALAAHALKMKSPKALLEKINKDLLQVMHSGFYLTGFYGILDLNTNVFRYTRASHPHPILVRPSGEKVMLNTKGLFLGAFEKPLYTEEEVQLQQGDRIYFCTDGCFEAVSSDGERMGYKDYANIVVSENHNPLEVVFEKISNKLKEFLGGDIHIDDDQTFLALQIEKPSREQRMKYLIRFHKNEPIHRIKIKNRDQLKTFMMIFADLLQNEGFSEKLNLNISSSVQDLILNSLEHGHRWDSSKNVMIAFCLTPKYLKLSVSDRGDGFNYEDIIRQGFIQTGRRGQGLFLVKTYMDEVYFDRGGSTITVVKHRN